jgi:hypothetical protein
MSRSRLIPPVLSFALATLALAACSGGAGGGGGPTGNLLAGLTPTRAVAFATPVV